MSKTEIADFNEQAAVDRLSLILGWLHDSYAKHEATRRQRAGGVAPCAEEVIRSVATGWDTTSAMVMLVLEAVRASGREHLEEIAKTAVAVRCPEFLRLLLQDIQPELDILTAARDFAVAALEQD